MTFLGATVAYKRAHFIGLAGLGEKLGPRAARAIVRALQLLTLALFALIAWFGVFYTVNAWQQTSTAVQMPMSLPLSCIPVAACVFLLHVLADIAQGKSAP